MKLSRLKRVSRMKKIGYLLKSKNFKLGFLLVLSGVYYSQTEWSMVYSLPVPKWVGYLWVVVGFVLIICSLFGSEKDNGAE